METVFENFKRDEYVSHFFDLEELEVVTAAIRKLNGNRCLFLPDYGSIISMYIV
jgi:hypothetical protein